MAIFITAIVVLLYAAWAVWWRKDSAAAPMGRGPKPKRNPCKWSETGDAKGRFVEYRCATCAVVALSHTGKPPQDCKKALSD